MERLKREAASFQPLKQALQWAEKRLEEIESASETGREALKQVSSLEKRLRESLLDAREATRMYEEAEMKSEAMKRDADRWKKRAAEMQIVADQLATSIGVGGGAGVMHEAVVLREKVNELQARIQILILDGDRGGEGCAMCRRGGGQGRGAGWEVETAKRRVVELEEEVRVSTEREKATHAQMEGALKGEKAARIAGERAVAAAVRRLRLIECQNAAFRNGGGSLDLSRLGSVNADESSFIAAFARDMLHAGDNIIGVRFLPPRTFQL